MSALGVLIAAGTWATIGTLIVREHATQVRADRDARKLAAHEAARAALSRASRPR